MEVCYVRCDASDNFRSTCSNFGYSLVSQHVGYNRWIEQVIVFHAGMLTLNGDLTQALLRFDYSRDSGQKAQGQTCCVYLGTAVTEPSGNL